MKLILGCALSPGDITVLTAAVRDLHASFPGEYETDVRTPCPALWENNPHLTRIENGDPDARRIPMHYPLIQQSNWTTAHFLDGFREYLAEQLGKTIRRGPCRGDIHLSAEELAAPSLVELLGGGTDYWLVVSGGKRDFTAKLWDPARWQAVVANFAGRVQFVQVGEAGHDHPPLTGALDLRGRTDLRALVNLVHRAAGVLCPVTALMHLCAAVPWNRAGLRPCVVVAGGREPVQWERYPGHTFLDTIGKLPCCASGGCWKSRVAPLGDGHDSSLCVRPVEIRRGVNLPACLDRITVADVIGAVENYLAEPPPERAVAPPEKPCCGPPGSPGTTENNPRIWGPRKWAELHGRPDALPDTMFSAPKLDRQRAETAWLAKFRDSLPCPDCAAHFDGQLAELPPVFDTREKYFIWTVDFHNAINRYLGKPQFSTVAACAARDWTRGASDRRSKCAQCEHFQPPAAHTGPWCRLASALVKPLIAAGSCPAGHWTLPTASTGDSAGIGMVIGTYAAVPYIHAQLESIRRFHPGMPVLVVDDGSDKGEALRAVCQRYGAELIVRPRRLNHARGDMDTFIQGHAWAGALGLRLLVKFSQRWLPVAPWTEALLALAAETDAATFNNHCVFHHFGFRSECVAMDVEAWRDSRALAPVIDMLERTANQPGDCDVGAGGVLVEHVIHVGAGIAARGRTADAGNYARWAWMGESRAVAQPGIIWHESQGAGAYLAQLQRWGIFDYTLADFINPAANLHG